MIGLLEVFKIGIGPSSSHTVGPMRAAYNFAYGLVDPESVAKIRVTFFGSLAWTGRGHASDSAVILGLAGFQPESIEREIADVLIAAVRHDKELRLGVWRSTIPFDPAADIVFDRKTPTRVHPNTVSFTALDRRGRLIAEERWCSVGGGAIRREGDNRLPSSDDAVVPYPFSSGNDLLAQAGRSGLHIHELAFLNECAVRPAIIVDAYLDGIIDTMMACIDRGLTGSGDLPGMRLKRRAAALRSNLETRRPAPHSTFDHVSMFAIAVSEENAAGGKVVTAPTNGAAGVIPAVLRYYHEFCEGADRSGMRSFLLTASAIGSLFKKNASISGAEVGCQGEIGVACSMAAAGLAASLGGTNRQIENAAEIGMEHNLGLTCDPIGGLVQVPCIERNAFGAIKAINAASLALAGNGDHHVSLDEVISAMRQTGADMSDKYKETSRGGLALSCATC